MMVESDQYQHSSGVFHLKQFSPDYSKARKNNKKVNPRKCRVYHYKKNTPLSLDYRPIEEICGTMNFFNKTFETYLSIKVDNDLINKTLEKIIKNRDFVNLDDKEKESIRILFLSYIARTQAKRMRDQNRIDHMKNLSKEMYKKSLESIFYDVPQNQLESDESTLKKFQTQQVYVLTKFPQLLEPYFWTLLINKTEIPFIITDNPVLTNSHISAIRKYVYQIQIPILGYPEGFFMPLNPRLGLVLYQCNKIYYPILPHKIQINNRNFMLILNNRMIRYAQKDIVTSVNSLNFLKSYVAWDSKCLKHVNFKFKKVRFNHQKSTVHKLIEHKPNFQCEKCNIPFETERQYTQHINDPLVHVKRTIKCPYCNKNVLFKDIGGLNQHIQAKHPNKLNKVI